MCTENTFADLLRTYADHPVPEFLRPYEDTPIMDEILPDFTGILLNRIMAPNKQESRARYCFCPRIHSDDIVFPTQFHLVVCHC